jgi:hypothetical protein
MSYAIQKRANQSINDYVIKNYGLLGLGQDVRLRNYPLLGLGDDCGADSVLVTDADGVGHCRDKSVMCGPGTQWVDQDGGCVPLTKYMSAAQIAAAVKAGVDLTGGGPPPQIVVAKAPSAPKPMVPSSSAASPSKLASMFSGPNAPWIIGGIAVAVLGLAAVSRKKPSHAHAR